MHYSNVLMTFTPRALLCLFRKLRSSTPTLANTGGSPRKLTGDGLLWGGRTYPYDHPNLNHHNPSVNRTLVTQIPSDHVGGGHGEPARVSPSPSGPRCSRVQLGSIGSISDSPQPWWSREFARESTEAVGRQRAKTRRRCPTARSSIWWTTSSRIQMEDAGSITTT